MKIVFIAGSLRGGGAERVLSLLANELSDRGNEVTVITKAPECDYLLHPSVSWNPIFKTHEIKSSYLNKLGRRLSFHPKLLLKVKKEKPDLVISFLVGMNGKAIIIGNLIKTPVIISEHINYQTDMNLFTWVERRWLYKLADAVTVLTKYDYTNYYSKFLDNVHIMPNPVSFQSVESLSPRNKTILASGSLDRWKHKGFDNLLKIFSNVVKKHPEWRLQIAGSGNKGEEYLKQLAKTLNIEKNIEFLGFCNDLASIMQASSIFILSSRYEGFPMVLIEAMSQGCACISYDCVTGPGEIINNGVDGILVENQNAELMETMLSNLISDESLRFRLGNNSKEAIKRLSIENIANNWEQLAESVLS